MPRTPRTRRRSTLSSQDSFPPGGLASLDESDRAPSPSPAAFAPSVSPFPRVAPADVLRALSSLSSEAEPSMAETVLVTRLHDILRELLPGRLIAVTTFDPKTSQPTEACEDSELSQAQLGFSLPLLAGDVPFGEVRVGYGSAGKGVPVPPPIEEDKFLVEPLANHVAVVAHTRRLLRESAFLHNYLEQILDHANTLIVATDLSGHVTVWNRAMQRVTGVSRSETVGRTLTQSLSNSGVSDLATLMKQASDGNAIVNREVRLPSEGGTITRAAFSVVLVRGQDTRSAAVLAVGHDLTALRSLQSQVIHAEKLATVGQIAAGVAHEINNPLTSIQVCAEAVLHKANLATQGRVSNQIDPVDVERLKRIQEGAERIQRFSRDLVAYARPSRVEVEPVSLNDVVEHALSFCEHVLVEARAVLKRMLDSSLPTIYAVRDQIMQVVTNLVTNAAHSLGDDGGVIGVRTYAENENRVGLSVSDTGCGIREEHQARIFDPFFTTKPAGRGTGLGLSVVRNIVYAHGGHITVQSRLGSGTTFVISLPANQLLLSNAEEETQKS